ncbi:MAG: conjugal transfer pilus assembly protein TraU [Gammaproteobacteria bacterium]|nr:conjugal transfer pilus assembly protein TraU [Gammaproteobacteria bacterium]
MRLKTIIRTTIIIIATNFFFLSANADPLCTGHFVNPISDIDWDALFPITIGDMKVVSSSLPDTANPSSPVCLCTTHLVPRIGVSFGYWEPFALSDVTRDPFCMVNLGGIKINAGNLNHDIGSKTESNAGYYNGSFYWVHWYKYPLIYWLEILADVGCMQTGDFDIGYFSEIDPSWNDDALTFIENPEAVLFGNPVTQLACLADATSTTTGTVLPNDSLFWCMGAQGSSYPLDGNVSNQSSPIQAALLLTERMDFKLHREMLIQDSVSQNSPALCDTHFDPIMPKSRYRYQMVNTIPDGDQAFPFGTNTMIWESGHTPPNSRDNFGFLIWRKRNCCML